jgi:hypothetical protein
MCGLAAMCGFAAKQAAVTINDRATDRTAIRVLIMQRFRQKRRSGSIAKIAIFSPGKIRRASHGDFIRHDSRADAFGEAS